MGNDDNGNSGPECRIAIITGETGAFPDMQHCLSPRFSATLAQTEKQIQAAVDDISVRAILIDLDSVGTNQSQATQLLQDLRQVREDLVLVAVTRSNSRSIPLKASQAGADEFFLAPLLLRLAKSGAEIHQLVMTDGDKSFYFWKREDAKENRRVREK